MAFVVSVKLNLVMDSVSRKAPALLVKRRQSMAFLILWRDEK